MRCRGPRASAQVIRPLPLSSHRARASTLGPGLGVAGTARVGVAVVEALGASTTMSVD